jgi:hypothetical protein
MIDGMRIWVMSSNMIATTKRILDKNGSCPSVTCCIAGIRVISRMEMICRRSSLSPSCSVCVCVCVCVWARLACCHWYRAA